jgi:hypothetical protein
MLKASANASTDRVDPDLSDEIRALIEKKFFGNLECFGEGLVFLIENFGIQARIAE